MAAGTVAIGLSGFVFLSAVGHGGLEPRVAAALSSVYLLSNILGPGVFVAIEQETSRRVSAAAAGGTEAETPGGPARSATGRAAAVLAVVTLLVLAVASVAPLDRVLGGNAALPVALGVGVVGSAAVFHLRGVLGGRRRFRRYATGLLVDAAVRIAGVLALTGTGSSSGTAYALALCAAPGVAALVTRPRGLPAGDGRGRGLPAAVGALLTASLLAMAVANLAPVLVAAALPADPARAFAFACALVLTRAPLLMTGPVQALLLPSLATAAARGDTGEVRRQLRRGLVATGLLGVLAVPVAGLAGRPVVALLFGRDADLLPAPVIAALTASAVLLLAVAVVQPALVALGGHRALVTGWVSGTIVFGGVFGAVAAAQPDPVFAAVAATFAGPAVTLLVTLTAARRSS